MPDWKSYVREHLPSLRLKAERELEIVQELAEHLESTYEEALTRGASAAEAYERTVAQIKDWRLLECEMVSAEHHGASAWLDRAIGEGNQPEKNQRGDISMGSLLQDFRNGLRVLLKRPGFTAVVVLSLALGIGANTAIFTLVDAVMLKLMPVRNPKELVIFAHSGKDSSSQESRSSNYPMYEFLRDRNQSLAGLFAFWPMDLKIRSDAGAQSVSGQFITANYFSVLGVNAMLGRRFSAADGADPSVVVISHRFWERRFGADPSVVGKPLVVNGVPLTVIGVTPPDFLGLLPGQPVDVSLPLAIQPRVLADTGNRLAMRGGWWALTIMGRLKPGVPVERASADLDVLLRQWLIENKVPDESIQRSFARAVLQPGGQGLDILRRRFSEPLLVLFGIVGLVLLIACANIANLMLARAAGRRKEMAVRLALGASRRRLIRQLLTEGVLLAAFGGMAGLLFGWWGSNLLVAFISSGPAQLTLDIHPDPQVLAFTAALALVTGILVSLAPALRSTRVDLTPALKENAAVAGFNTRSSSGRVLVTVQVALSLCLVIGATLFAFSLRNITSLNAGFRVENLLFVTFDTFGAGYNRDRLKAFYHEALARAGSLPGVSAAAMSSLMPLSGDDTTRGLNVPGFTARTRDDEVVHVNYVSAAYFETLGMPVSKGREFSTGNGPGAPNVAVVNETLARFYFADADPIGRVVQIREPGDPPVEIVGVVKDAKQKDLREAASRMIYLPSLQYSGRPMTLEIRTALDPAAMATTVRQAMSDVSRDIPISEIKTAQAQLEGGIVKERLLATLSGFFGALALLLAALGLYGTLSHLVTRKTGEIGIRMALGAERRDVLRLVMGESASPVLIGVAVGLLAAWAARSLVTDFLFGLTAMNPVVLVVSVAVLLATAAVAAYLPARRAMKVDPIVALRCE